MFDGYLTDHEAQPIETIRARRSNEKSVYMAELDELIPMK